MFLFSGTDLNKNYKKETKLKIKKRNQNKKKPTCQKIN